MLLDRRRDEREGCFIERVAESDYIHEVEYLEHSRSAVCYVAVTIVEHSS